MWNKYIERLAYLIVFLGSISCTEEIEIENISYENILVVEATLTNQMKQQTVKLTRTITLNDTIPRFESNANVRVESDGGETFRFSQDQEGFYTSDQSFMARENIMYKLLIDTNDGEKYQSLATTLTPLAEILNVYPERQMVNGILGAQVLVDAIGEQSGINYFKYEYEETYKLRVPKNSDSIGKIINYIGPAFTDGCPEFNITFEAKTKQDSICYKTVKSEGILQTSTLNLATSNIERFPVRFLASDDPVLRERYSILVKQYVQSIEAYSFYKIINDLGSPESLLSESQPGFVSGNVSNQNNREEKVLGFFEVSSVSEKRIFFNHIDFTFPVPPYFVDCTELVYNYLNCPSLPPETCTDDIFECKDQRSLLHQRVSVLDYRIINVRFPEYTVVPPQCNDCTTFANNVRPDFWID